MQTSLSDWKYAFVISALVSFNEIHIGCFGMEMIRKPSLYIDMVLIK